MGLCFNHCAALEFEGQPPIGVDSYRVNDGQPEFFVELRKGIQFLNLKHKCSDGFCLVFPCCFCSADLLKLCGRFFVALHKAIAGCHLLPGIKTTEDFSTVVGLDDSF